MTNHLRHRRSSHRARVQVPVPDPAAAAAEAVVRYLRESSVATAERGGGQPAGAGPEPMTAGGPGTGLAADAAVSAQEPGAAEMSAAVEQAMPWRVAWPDAIRNDSESVATAAAAASIAALDRIEAMAAKLETDIAAAHRAQAELQAGAGAAAEAAVRAAEEAAEAARSAIEADKRAKISLIKVARYVEVTIVLLVIAMVILVVTATTVH
jgi:hypothetical protein